MSLDVELYIMVDTGGYEPARISLYEANITHNCGVMADQAGVYGMIWRPEEERSKVKKAGDIVKRLGKAIDDMEKRPEHYKKFEADNGWGTYDQFVLWLQEYLEACVEHPKALVRASR